MSIVRIAQKKMKKTIGGVKMVQKVATGGKKIHAMDGGADFICLTDFIAQGN